MTGADFGPICLFLLGAILGVLIVIAVMFNGLTKVLERIADECAGDAEE